MIADMASLLAPASLGEFLAAMESKRRLHVRATDPHRFSDLFPWQTANTLFFINRLGTQEIDVMQASKPVSPLMYRDPVNRSLRLDVLHALADQGASIVINSVHKLVPAIDAVSAMVERALRSKTWVNTYLSFREKGALLPHWDEHDVIVMHLRGRKRWRCYGMQSPFPISSGTFGPGADPGRVEWEEVLEPGDLLYLPRGEIHAASVEDGGATVHLTMAVTPPRGSDVVRWMAQSTDDVLRMDVFPHWNAGELKLYESRLKEAFHRLIDGIDLTEILKALDEAQGHHPAPNIGMSLDVDGSTILRSALRRRVSVPLPISGSVDMKIGSTAYRLSAAAAALLAMVQERDSVTVATAQVAMAQQNSEDIYRAVRELLQKGLVHRDLPREVAGLETRNDRRRTDE